MELDREQIEHTLEICSSGDEQCAYCCLLAFDGCARKLAKLALARIHELTEERERWRAEAENQSVLWKQHFESIYETAKGTVKADTVQKMQERLKAEMECWILDFEYYSEKMKAFDRIDQIAKKLLEEGGVQE